MYSEFTNQVPATWFAGDAGIRRLALQSDGPVHRGRRRFCGPVFSPVSSDQLQGPAQQPLGIAQTLFGLADGCPEILATRRDRQRANFCKLLPISLYVFGDDRQSCGDGVVHRSSLARRMTKSRLPGLQRCRYRDHLCIR